MPIGLDSIAMFQSCCAACAAVIFPANTSAAATLAQIKPFWIADTVFDTISASVNFFVQVVTVCTIFKAAKPPATPSSIGAIGLSASMHISTTFVSSGITVLAIFDTVLINVENAGFKLFSAPVTALAIVLKLSMIVFPSSPTLRPTSLPKILDMRADMICTPTSATFGMI